MKRTDQQNRALHLYFRLLADKLNANGLDMKKVLKPGVEIAWNEDMVKNYLWRPIQTVLTQKLSTTELTSGEPGRIYEVLQAHLNEKFCDYDIDVEFPHIPEDRE